MGVTDKWALPYPEADTLISVSAPIVQELAEKIDAALSAVTASDSYIIPGTLIGDFTTSGTFTPPAGVTLVHVAVIGGGGSGGNLGEFGNVHQTGSGGTGGGLRVFRNMPLSVPVSVVVGGAATGSAFGTATAPGGQTASGHTPGQTPNGDSLSTPGIGRVKDSANKYWFGTPGGAGPTINGTPYTGGGGGGAYGSEWNTVYAGGAGGGGAGNKAPASNGSGERPAENGVAGTGGGGGGGGAYMITPTPGSGGSGRVMVWTEQTTRETFAAPIDPVVMAALDDAGVMVGAYAIDPVAPVDTLGTLVPYPTEPVPTGQTWTDDETGETHPVLAWPAQGWHYNDGEWSPPNA